MSREKCATNTVSTTLIFFSNASLLSVHLAASQHFRHARADDCLPEDRVGHLHCARALERIRRHVHLGLVPDADGQLESGAYALFGFGGVGLFEVDDTPRQPQAKSLQQSFDIITNKIGLGAIGIFLVFFKRNVEKRSSQHLFSLCPLLTVHIVPAPFPLFLLPPSLSSPAGHHHVGRLELVGASHGRQRRARADCESHAARRVAGWRRFAV